MSAGRAQSGSYWFSDVLRSTNRVKIREHEEKQQEKKRNKKEYRVGKWVEDGGGREYIV